MSEKDQQSFYEQAEKTNTKWYSYFLNKYTVVGIVFLVWMIFFDQNSVLIHQQLNKDIKALEDDKAYYQENLNEENEKLNNIKNNPAELERIAREKHFLKKPSEDLFIIQQEIIEKPDSTKNEK